MATSRLQPKHTDSTVQLLYDGDCPMCKSLVEQLSHWGFLSDIQAVPLQEAHWINDNLRERGRAEVLLVDNSTGTVWGGVDVFLQLFRRRGGVFHIVSQPCMPAFVYRSAQWLYQTIAYNRRALFPVGPKAIPCHCDPPINPAITRRFYRILLLLMMTSTLIFSLGVCYRPDQFSLISSVRLFVSLLVGSLAGWLGGGLLLAACSQKQQNPELKDRKLSFWQGLSAQTFISLWLGSLYLAPVGILLLSFHPHPLNVRLGDESSIILGLGIQAAGTCPPLWQRLGVFRVPVWIRALWFFFYGVISLLAGLYTIRFITGAL